MAACFETLNRTSAGRHPIEREPGEGGMDIVHLARGLKIIRMTGVAPRR